MLVTIDIETIPEADKDRHLEEARSNFKAPSGITKAEMGKDLSLTDEQVRFTSANDLKAQWEKEMAETKGAAVADIAWRKTALDATYGRVLCIGWSNDRGAQSIVDVDNDERKLIEQAFEIIHHQCGARPPHFIGHNVCFDLKFLFRRAAIHGIKPPFQLPFRGRHDKDYFCTMQAWCEHGERISLNNLARALGLDGKMDFDGSMVCDAWLNGELVKVADYCQSDVELTQQVYRKLMFI